MSIIGLDKICRALATEPAKTSQITISAGKDSVRIVYSMKVV